MADQEVVLLPSIADPSSDFKRKHEDLDGSDVKQDSASSEDAKVTSVDDEGTVTKRMKFDSLQEADGTADDISEGEYRPTEDKTLDLEMIEAESNCEDLDFDKNGPEIADKSDINEMGNEDSLGPNEEGNENNADKNELRNEYSSGINEVALDNSETNEVGNVDNPDINEIGKSKYEFEFHEIHPENPMYCVLPVTFNNDEAKDTDQCSIQEPGNVSVETNLEDSETVVLSRDATKPSSLEFDVQTEVENGPSDNVEIPSEELQSLGVTKSSYLENEEHIDHEKSNTLKLEIPNDEVPSLDNTKVLPLEDEIPVDDDTVTSRKIEIPNDKVGVLIGKGGDTIRFIQSNADAKIQIMRDAEADLHSVNRPVEIVGKLSCIIKAKKLIDAVIAEANAGGSPSLVARGLSSGQASGHGEQVEMQVPNDKVGLIIGRRGENIKSLQARSGARIQLIPQHQPEGDGSKNRIVRLTGDRRQVKTATDMILDVMNQVRGSYGPHNHPPHYGPSGHGGPSYWGSQGSHHQPMYYDYPSRPSHYGSFSMPQMPPRIPSWEQRPFSHGPTFDSYNARAHPPPGPYMGPPNQTHFYPQSQPSEYSHQTPYPPHTYPTNQPYPTQQYSKQPSYQQPYGPPRIDATYPSASQQYSYAPSYLQPTSTDVYNQASAYPQNTTVAGYVQPAASAYAQGGSAAYGQYMYGEQGGYQVSQEGSYGTNTGMAYAQPASAQAASQPAVYDHSVAQQSGGASAAAQPPTAYGYDSGQTFAAPH